MASSAPNAVPSKMSTASQRTGDAPGPGSAPGGAGRSRRRSWIDRANVGDTDQRDHHGQEEQAVDGD